MASSNNIAIAGISSRLALQICKELVQHPDVRIRGSARDTSRLPAWVKQCSQIDVIQMAPDDTDALRSLVKGCDVVVCCYLADQKTMEDGQKLLIDAAEIEGVQRYIASDYTLDYTKTKIGENEYKDPMKIVKAYLETKPSLKGVHILVGIFMELYWEYWAPWDPVANTLSYWGKGDERWECTRYNDVARYAAAVARDSTSSDVLKFLGDRKSIHEIAEDLSRAHGVRPTPKRLGSLDDLFKRAHRDPSQQDILAAGEYYELSGQCSLGDNLDNSRYPHIEPESFFDFFQSRSLAELKPRGADAMEEKEFRT